MSAAPVGMPRVAQFRDGQAVLAPVTATFTPGEGDDRPTVTIDVDVVDGRAVVTRCELIGSSDNPIAADELRTYSVVKLASHALTSFTLDVSPDGTGYVPSDTKKSRESIITAVKAREQVGADRLDDVLTFYRAGGVTAVEKHLGVSRSQAYRLIARAKEAGN
jgi:hypothetical protein